EGHQVSHSTPLILSTRLVWYNDTGCRAPNTGSRGDHRGNADIAWAASPSSERPSHMTDHHKSAATTPRTLAGIAFLLRFATSCASAASTGRNTATHTAASATGTPHGSSATTSSPAPGGVAGAYLGLVNMGMPTAPQPFMSDAFAITKHQR